LYVAEGGGTVYGPRGRGRGQAVTAGDAIHTRAGGARGLAAGGDGARLVQLRVPAGGSAGPAPRRGAAPMVRRAADVAPLALAGGAGSVQLLLDAASAGDPTAYVGLLTGQPGMAIPSHIHDTSTELL